MEHWWNDTDKENQNTQRKSCSVATLFPHKSHMDWPGIILGPPWWEAVI